MIRTCPSLAIIETDLYHCQMAGRKKSKTLAVPSRRGAPLKGEPSARERILATASDLFYREGIRAIGIDTVIAASGVSKASLYRAFDSKDALVAAFMTERDRMFWIWWDKIAAKHADNPRALLDALLEGVVSQINRVTYRGCPFLNMATEFPDDAHPGRIVARANKDEMRRRLAELCARIGVSHPERIAGQLMLLINGAYATGQMAGDADLRRNLVDAAACLIG
jgi:AcrR family transcriptional regulator